MFSLRIGLTLLAAGALVWSATAWVCMRCIARCQKIRAPRQRSVTEARGPWFIFRPALFEVVLPNSP